MIITKKSFLIYESGIIIFPTFLGGINFKEKLRYLFKALTNKQK